MGVYIHASCGIRTQDPNVRAGEDLSRLRPHGHCNRSLKFSYWNLVTICHLSYGCYIPCSSHSPRFDGPNNVLWKVTWISLLYTFLHPLSITLTCCMPETWTEMLSTRQLSLGEKFPYDRIFRSVHRYVGRRASVATSRLRQSPDFLLWALPPLPPLPLLNYALAITSIYWFNFKPNQEEICGKWRIRNRFILEHWLN